MSDDMNENPNHLTLHRVLGAHAFVAEVSGPCDLLVQMADAFEDLPAFAPGDFDQPLGVSVRVEKRIDGRPFFRIEIEGMDPWRVEEPRAAVDHIVTSLTRQALERGVGRLHLHAGLVSTDHGALLFTGPSGAGKSTLVAAALRNGAASYVTDEMISIDLENADVCGLVKPLTFKRATWGLHEDLLGPTPTEGERWSVRASRLGSVSDPGPHQVRMIVFPQFQDNAQLTLTHLHPTRALTRLVSETLDMERDGARAFRRMADVVAHSACVALEYHCASSAVAELVDQLDSRTVRPESSKPLISPHVPTDIHPVRPADPTALHRRRAASTVSLVLNGRAALYSETTGVAADLDEVATLWWLELDGLRSVSEIAQQFADLSEGDAHEIETAGSQMISELADVGFVQ